MLTQKDSKVQGKKINHDKQLINSTANNEKN